VDLSRANLGDNPDLAGHKDAVFLDIQVTLSILKALFLPQPLTSNLEVPDGKTSQNGQASLLTGRPVLLGLCHF